MGRLYDLIQEHIDSQGYRVSKRQVAGNIGVAPSTIDNWREPKELIDKAFLVSIARVTRNPYNRVLDALLFDIGYLHEEQEPVAKPKSHRKTGRPPSLEE